MGFFEYNEERLAFHFLYERRGGIYGYAEEFDVTTKIYDWLLNAANMHVNLILSSRKLQDKVRVHINYVNNDSIGAVVTKENNIYHIGINIGTVQILYSIFNRMLCSPNVLVKYGNPSAENKDYKLTNPHTTSLNQLMIQDIKHVVFPSDKKRGIVAAFLTQTAVNFLITHELGHILNGHIDYFKSEGILAWDETDTIPEPITNIEIVQTLEYDADSFGWNNMINLAFKLNTDSASSTSNAKFIFENLQDVFGLTCFAIYSTFRLFGIDVPNDNNLLSKKHPHPRLRREFMAIGLYSLLGLKLSLNRFDKEIEHLLCMEIASSIRDAEKAFVDITRDAQELTDEQMQKLVWLDNVGEYTDKLNKRWLQVREMLLPYAFTDLVPPQS